MSQPHQITVRDARTEDQDRIVQFNRAMARETEGRDLDPATVRKGVRALLEDPVRGRYFVAERDGRMAGQAMVTTEWSDWRNAPVWWIQSVYVAQDQRRTGVYRALHEHIRTRARENGGAGLRLYVDRENEGARRTYEELGMDRSTYVMYEEMWSRAI